MYNLIWQQRVSHPLHNYRVLVADADQQLALVLKTMLTEMGFANVQLTRSGADALKLLQDNSFDFLITEWGIQHFDGIELLNRIRRDSHSPNPTLPIIMLTGRAEQSDVVTARDSGINEYVVKPFSAKTIFSRLERIVDYPRHFVVSQRFVGPDRRHRGKPADGSSDRRTNVIHPQRQPKDAAKELISVSAPKLWLPDYSLKHKLSSHGGMDVSLPSIITPAVLNMAQASIDAITSDSLQWIKANIADIRTLHQYLTEGRSPSTIAANLSEVALTISSRAGTFGYSRASEVAYMLYLFCRNKLQPDKPIHHVIVEKHIDVLQVMLSNDIRGNSDSSTEIVAELRNLANKYAG